MVLDNGVNDAPVNSVPTAQTTQEDMPLVFSLLNGNAITVSDQDAGLGTNALTITLVAENGTVVPTAAPGVTVVPNPVMVTAANSITVGNGAAMIGQQVAVGGVFFNFVDNALVAPLGPTDVSIGMGDADSDVATALAAVINDPANFGPGTATETGAVLALTGVTASNPSDPAIVINGATITTQDGNTVVGSHLSVGGLVFTYVDAAIVATPAATEIAVNLGDADTDVATKTAAVLNTSFTATTAMAALNVVTLSGVNAEDSLVTLTGEIPSLNLALLGLQFVPGTNYVGPASLILLSEDGGQFTIGGGDNLQDVDTVSIQVTPGNDDPFNAGTLPTDVTVTEDQSSNVDLSLVNFADIDALSGSLTVTLTTSTGGNLSAASGTGITIGGTPTALTISGTLTDLNNYFNTASNITYLHSTMHLNGDDVDTIQVAINDNGNTGAGGGTDIDLGTVNVDISPVNDDPENLGSLPTDITVTEDISGNVDLSLIDLADVDSAAGNLTVTLTTGAGGTLAALPANGVAVTGSTTGVLTLSGNLTDLNAYLDAPTVRFTSFLNANGDNADTIQVDVTDNGNTGTGGGGTIGLGTINVDITAVNDDPINAGTPPADVVVTEDIASDVDLSSIDLLDVDSATGDLSITLTVGSGGTLDAVSAAGVTVGGSGTGILTLTGTQASLNAFLDITSSIQYTGVLNVNGDDADTIRVDVTDGGNTGLGGGGIINLATVNVDIDAVNDDPTNEGSLPTDVTVVEDIASDVDLSLLDLQDIDAAAGDLTITLTTGAGGGVLFATGTGGVTVTGDGSGVLTLSGTQAELNAFVDVASNIQYRGSLNVNGDDADTIKVEVSDNGNTGTGGGGAIDLGTVNVDITAVNDDPENLGGLPPEIMATEDVAGDVDLSLVNLADVDSATGDLSLTLTTTSGGRLTATGSGGVIVGGSGSRSLSLRGTLAELNAYLDDSTNINFISALNANGDAADSIQVNLTDNGNTGIGGGGSIDLGFVDVNIAAVNDDPINAGTLPTDVTVIEDESTSIALGLINLSDVDAVVGNLTLTLTVGSSGTLSAVDGTGITVGGRDTGVLTLTGNQTDLNAFLDGPLNIQFTGALNVNGDDADSIQISVTDNGNTGSGGGSAVDLGTVNVDITAANDDPENVGGLPTDITVSEDLASDVDLSQIDLADVDAATGELTVILTTAGGALSAVDANGVTVAGSGSQQLMLTGNLTDLNAFLDQTTSVQFTSMLNVNGDDADTIHVEVTDNGNVGIGGGDRIDLGTVNVDIDPVNDDPINAGSLPRDIAVTEDLAGDVDLSLIELADVDAADGVLTLTLTALMGGSLSAVDGGGVTVGGSGTGVLMLSGTLIDLNAFLDTAANIQFTSALNANGNDADMIQVEVNDNGNAGSGGGTNIDLGTVNLDIGAVNDDPTNAGSLPADVVVQEDSVSDVDLSAIDVADPDSASGNLMITLTAGTGILTSTSGGGVIVGGSGSNVITLTGEQSNLNAFLDDSENITYLGVLNANGNDADAIQIEVTDNGNVGSGGGGTIDFGSVNVDINPVNDPPTAVPVVLDSIVEDSSVIITQASLLVGSSDIDGDVLSAINLTLTEGNGTLVDNLDGTSTFTPDQDWNGNVSFSFDVDDGTTSIPNTASLVVTNQDDPPTAEDDTLDTDEDTVLRIESSDLLANDDDPDLGPGSPEELSVVLMPAVFQTGLGASVSFDAATGEITYDPTTSTVLQNLAPGQSLQDSFSYSVTDLDGEPTLPTADVFLNVFGVNDAPLAVDDLVPAPMTLDPIVILPLTNDVDVDGQLDPDSFIVTEDPIFGSIAKRINDQGELELAYSPFDNFVGTDSFRYTISDNLGQPSAQATVTLEASQAPVTGSDIGGSLAGDSIALDVLQNDFPVAGTLDPSTLMVVTDPTNGVAVPGADGTITYTPNPGFFGIDSFQYTVSDTEGNVSPPTTVTVRAVESGRENPLMFGDVNANGEVTALDALLVINRLSLFGGQASVPVRPFERGPDFHDVNGNLVITALDALLVINNIGGETPVISAELIEEPIVADTFSVVGNSTDDQPVDNLFDEVGVATTNVEKVVDVSDGYVDDAVVNLLAEEKTDDDEETDVASAMNDLALRDLE